MRISALKAWLISVWTFARLGHISAALAEGFRSQSLASAVWASATLSHASPALCDANAEAAKTRVKDVCSQSLVTTAWAFAKAGHVASHPFDAFAEVARRCHGDLANIVWACTKDGHTSVAPYVVAATTRATDFNSQSLASFFWIYATVAYTSEAPVDTTAEVAISPLRDFKPRSLANTAWTIANTGVTSTCAVGDTPVAQYLAQALLPYYVIAMTTLFGIGTRIISPTSGKAWMVWTFSRELFDTIAEVTRSRLKHINSQHLEYTAVSLTCTVGNTPVAQYLACFHTISLASEQGSVFRYLERPGWFGLPAVARTQFGRLPWSAISCQQCLMRLLRMHISSEVKTPNMPLVLDSAHAGGGRAASPSLRTDESPGGHDHAGGGRAAPPNLRTEESPGGHGT